MGCAVRDSGGHYCPKKTDDLCGDVCGQVIIIIPYKKKSSIFLMS